MGRAGAGKIRETFGLILSAKPFSESSDVVIFLTNERGVEEGVALGRRRVRSKDRAALQTLCLSKLLILERERSQLIIGAKLKKSWQHIAREPEKFILVGRVLRVVKHYCRGTEGLLDEVVEFLNNPTRESALTFYQVLLKRLGFEGLRSNSSLEGLENLLKKLF